MDILDEFYFGNIIPHEHSYRTNKQYKEALASFHQSVEQLDAQLSDDEKGLLEKVLDANADIALVAEAESFKLGFRIGVQIMCSCFYGKTVTQ